MDSKSKNNLIQRLNLPLAPTLFVLGFTFTVGFCDGFLAGAGIRPSTLGELIYRIGFIWAFSWWLVADAKRIGYSLPFDVGFFIYMAWPFYLPYYVLKTRRYYGLLPIGLVVMLYLLSMYGSFFMSDLLLGTD